MLSVISNMLSNTDCMMGDSDREHQEAYEGRDIETLITEFNNMLDNLLKANSANVQVALTNTAERLKTEMQSSQEYHDGMAKSLSAENTDQTIVLQHRILAEVYRSLADCV